MYQPMDRIQKTFCPVDYFFQFGDGWYTWQRTVARKAALQARNAYAKELKAAGWTVRLFSEPNQLITKGGIGTGQPQIENVVTVYGVEARR